MFRRRDRDSTHGRPARSRAHRWGHRLWIAGVVLACLLTARLVLPTVVERYVNRTLDQNADYDGEIAEVDLHLWRGAYTIHGVRIVKTTGSVPVPLFAADRVELSVEWPSLLSGEVVGKVVMVRPELNFVDAENPGGDQTGAGAPWLDVFQDLFPLDLNGAEVRNGVVRFRAFDSDPPVDVYLSRVEGELSNLTNVHEDVTPLFATLRLTGRAMDEAPVEVDVRIDPLSYRPTFRLAARMLDLDVTKTNDLTSAYAGFDFEHGRFDLVIEMDAKAGRVDGYVKPLFRDVAVVDLWRDADPNVFRTLWEAVVGVASELFKNLPRDQIATVVPFGGDLDDPSTDLLATIGNLLRNAFVRAYLPRLQGVPGEDLVTFGPGQLPGLDPRVQSK